MGNCASIAGVPAGQPSQSQNRNLTHAVVAHDPTVKVSIHLKDESAAQEYDLLIVAADPQDGLTSEIMPKTSDEQTAFDTDVMKAFTFQTTLMKFPKLAAKDYPTVRFFPQSMNVTAGSAYGYRSETRKEAVYLASSDNPSNVTDAFEKVFATIEYEYVTVYQLLDPSRHGSMSEENMWDKLDKEMKDGVNKGWFPYVWKDGELVNRFHTKYFCHYTMDSLTRSTANDWSILGLQGRYNTIYVHASTAFESVLHIYEYINMLWTSKRDIFPTNKASRIAVVGGGPSGLLAAHRLAKEGYTNITVLESKPNNNDPNTKMLSGKTQTNIVHQLDQNIPAELGTCYLSPAYDNMIRDFERCGLVQGQSRVSFDQVPTGPVLREIVTAKQFHEDGPAVALYIELYKLSSPPPNMPFEQYSILKGFDEHYAGQQLAGDELVEKWQNFNLGVLARAVVKYLVFHYTLFGFDAPFPYRKTALVMPLLQKSVYQFLKDEDLLSLLGTLQYGYSVQGYGSTAPDTEMSAYYLFMWVTPPIFLASLGNEVKDWASKELQKNFPFLYVHLKPLLKDEPIVTAWTKGWGDVWRQLKLLFEANGSGVNIKYEQDIHRIVRQGVQA